MNSQLNRRTFLSTTATAFSALVLSGCRTAGSGAGAHNAAEVYGALVPDPNGLLDLPEGFSYRLISTLGQRMSDGGTVPDRADGMGCLTLNDEEIVLIRNHELKAHHDAGGKLALGYGTKDGQVLPGGTTHIVLDARTAEVKREFRSLSGTIENCSGGITPWGSWLTCEETVAGKGLDIEDGTGLEQVHGWVFEVPADATGPIDPVPLKAMGRFNHEAACVDPKTGIVYQTEDRDDSVLYRFIPAVSGDLAQGGTLQAMRIKGVSDTRNWDTVSMTVGQRFEVEWDTLDDVESLKDDLRYRASRRGAAIVARGEGIHMGEDEIFVCATSGGAIRHGQVFKLIPGRGERPDTIELFFESTDPDQFDYGDNVTVGPNGHLIVCEDQGSLIVDNYLRGITAEGRVYPFARLRVQTELAGGCFSPDGKWFFVNAYSPTRTFAITGPWAA